MAGARWAPEGIVRRAGMARQTCRAGMRRKRGGAVGAVERASAVVAARQAARGVWARSGKTLRVTQAQGSLGCASPPCMRCVRYGANRVRIRRCCLVVGPDLSCERQAAYATRQKERTESLLRSPLDRWSKVLLVPHARLLLARALLGQSGFGVRSRFGSRWRLVARFPPSTAVDGGDHVQLAARLRTQHGQGVAEILLRAAAGAGWHLWGGQLSEAFRSSGRSELFGGVCAQGSDWTRTCATGTRVAGEAEFDRIGVNGVAPAHVRSSREARQLR